MASTQAGQLDTLIKALVMFQSPEAITRISKALKADALELVADGFARQSDPYGKPWSRSRAARDRGGQTLRASGRLNRSFTRDSSAGVDRVVIGTNVKYAPVHQFGATIKPKNAKFLKFKVGRGSKKRFVTTKVVVLPPRPMLPLTGLPAKWRVSLERATIAATKALTP